LKEGDIVYLTAAPIPSSSIIRQHPNQSRFENHPVVVLGKERQWGTAIVDFRQLTTFAGVAVEDKKVEQQRHFYMMVQNRQDEKTASTHPIARMAPGFDPLAKRSYVNLSPNSRFKIEYKYLEAFGTDGLRRLDAESVSYIQRARSIH
jgi:hypothetical protein